MKSFPLLEKIATALIKNNIDYMVIGGQAILLYGNPRFTNDIDIVLDSDVSKLNLIKEICEENELIRLNDDKFTMKTNVVPVYDKKEDYRIDLMFSFTEFEKNAISRAQNVLIDKTNVKYASIEDVIIMKLFASRAIDLEDVKIVLMKNHDIDKNYITEWLKRFDETPDSDLLNKFNSIIENL